MNINLTITDFLKELDYKKARLIIGTSYGLFDSESRHAAIRIANDKLSEHIVENIESDVEKRHFVSLHLSNILGLILESKDSKTEHAKTLFDDLKSRKIIEDLRLAQRLDGRFWLNEFARAGFDGDMANLLHQNGEDIDACEKSSDGGLPAIAFCSNLSFAEKLIELGADINRRKDYFFNTPLGHCFSSSRNFALAKILIRSGADPFFVSKENDSVKAPIIGLLAWRKAKHKDVSEVLDLILSLWGGDETMKKMRGVCDDQEAISYVENEFLNQNRKERQQQQITRSTL